MSARYEASARQLVRHGSPAAARSTVLMIVGHSVEFALKAAIMRQEGLNRWPRPGDPGWESYHTHNLNKLAAKLGWGIKKKDPVAPHWQAMIGWSRTNDYTYDPKPTPLKVAHGYIDAAYGQDGIMEWIRAKLS